MINTFAKKKPKKPNVDHILSIAICSRIRARSVPNAPAPLDTGPAGQQSMFAFTPADEILLPAPSAQFFDAERHHLAQLGTYVRVDTRQPGNLAV